MGVGGVGSLDHSGGGRSDALENGCVSYQGDGLGGQVQHFDLVVVGVGHVEQPATAAGAQSSRLVEAGPAEIGAESVSSLAGAGQSAALFRLWIHHLDLHAKPMVRRREGGVVKGILLIFLFLSQISQKTVASAFQLQPPS